MVHTLFCIFSAIIMKQWRTNGTGSNQPYNVTTQGPRSHISLLCRTTRPKHTTAKSALKHWLLFCPSQYYIMISRRSSYDHKFVITKSWRTCDDANFRKILWRFYNLKLRQLGSYLCHKFSAHLLALVSNEKKRENTYVNKLVWELVIGCYFYLRS